MRVFAPAKVNLALHVTGRRADGYHLLDSLVVFTGIGDHLEFRDADEMSLSVTGPFAAGVPTDERNLVWRAANWLSADRSVAIALEKHLPHAAGIGGGSSDAAATLRGLSALWDFAVPDGAQVLGADLPVCLRGTPARMRGIGEVLEDVPELPPMWLALVNPGVAVPTGPVFNALECVNHPPLPDAGWSDFAGFIEWLRATRNDLEPSARGLQPLIGTVLDRLNATQGCALARMSGSGATCFGIFEREAEARAAAAAMPEEWWALAGPVLGAAPG